ncbi:MAG: 2-oxoacid:ferredoxin oxidoreductase subunit beta [Thermoprotei archaeon]|nr:MAG: 2-oxoacid:ferredoxin oxidoreductase subunit beta [Thermoprotei archaeon]RLE99275.1 MAG: 2-oxoacid:ferredoxin oxidoreductase subunit beta [Thermoprotei archaeon]
MNHPLDKYLRLEAFPTIWCPGCGNGIILAALARALDKVGVDLDKIVLITGIGCTGRMATYLYTDNAHVLHGRAIPFATGVKLAKPDLEVIVVGGDGDILAIGGNHLIHAARRNMDLIVIMVNNQVYAMTGGQVAPTTPVGAYTTTTPYGNIMETPFNAVKLVSACHPNYVARWTVAHPVQLTMSIERCLRKRRGFRFIEVISTCPTIYGRLNKMGRAPDMIKYLKKVSVIKPKALPEEAELSPSRIVCGVFLDREEEGYIDKLNKYRGEAVVGT